MQLFIPTANAFARMDGNRLRLAVGWVALFITLTYGYFLIRDVRDMLSFLPIRSLWPKEQIETDIDVLSAWSSSLTGCTAASEGRSANAFIANCWIYNFNFAG